MVQQHDRGFLACALAHEQIVKGTHFHLLQWRGAETMGSACPTLVPKISAATVSLVLYSIETKHNKT